MSILLTNKNQARIHNNKKKIVAASIHKPRHKDKNQHLFLYMYDLLKLTQTVCECSSKNL